MNVHSYVLLQGVHFPHLTLFVYLEIIVHFLLKRSIQKYLNQPVWGGHTHDLCHHTWHPVELP